jgi:hypothetical protein
LENSQPDSVRAVDVANASGFFFKYLKMKLKNKYLKNNEEK